MQEQLQTLKNRIFGKKSSSQGTVLTDILEMAMNAGCVGEIIGRDFEVRDSQGNLVYTIRQKPITTAQLNTLLMEFSRIQRRQDEREAAKFGGKKGFRSPRKR